MEKPEWWGLWLKHTDDRNTLMTIALERPESTEGCFVLRWERFVCVYIWTEKILERGKGWRFKKAIMIPLLTSQRVISLEFRSRVQYTELCKCTSIIKAWELSNQRSIYWIVNLGNSTLYGLYGWLILEAFWVTSMEYVGMKKWLKSLSSPHSYLIPGALIAFEWKTLTGQTFMILSSKFLTCVWDHKLMEVDSFLHFRLLRPSIEFNHSFDTQCSIRQEIERKQVNTQLKS